MMRWFLLLFSAGLIAAERDDAIAAAMRRMIDHTEVRDAGWRRNQGDCTRDFMLIDHPAHRCGDRIIAFGSDEARREE